MKMEETGVDWVDYVKYLPTYRCEVDRARNGHIEIVISPAVQCVRFCNTPTITEGVFGYNPLSDVKRIEPIEVDLFPVSGKATSLELKDDLEKFLVKEYMRINAERIMRSFRESGDE